MVDVNGKQLPAGSNASFTSYGFSPVLPHRQPSWPAFLSLSFLASLTAFFSLCFSYLIISCPTFSLVALLFSGLWEGAHRKQTPEKHLSIFLGHLWNRIFNIIQKNIQIGDFNGEEYSVAYESQAEKGKIPLWGCMGRSQSESTVLLILPCVHQNLL